MIRKVVGVITGYVVFAVTALALFKLSGQNPHEESTLTFQTLTALYGSVFSFLSGLILQLIARTKNLNTNYVLAIIMVIFATFSLFKAEGSHWTQLLAIFVFAPASILGGVFYIRRNRK